MVHVWVVYLIARVVCVGAVAGVRPVGVDFGCVLLVAIEGVADLRQSVAVVGARFELVGGVAVASCLGVLGVVVRCVEVACVDV